MSSRRIPQPFSDLGDFQRLTDDCVADLLVGLTVAQLWKKDATFSKPARRPQLREVPTCTSWPPPVNSYTETGQILDPQSALSKPVSQVGYALTTPELRAAILGLLTDDQNCAGLERLRETFAQLARGHLQALQRDIRELRERSSSTTTTTIISPALLPQAIIRGAGHHGDVVRRIVSGLHSGDIEVASGPDADDQETLLGILGQDWPDGALATYYPNGTKAPPLATLPPGPLYRSNTGAAAPYALPPLILGEATKGVGIASPAGIDVILDWHDVTVT